MKDKIIRNRKTSESSRKISVRKKRNKKGEDTANKKKDNRFASHKRDIIIIGTLNSRKCFTKRGRNFLQIIDKILETKVKSIKIVKSGFNAVRFIR